MKTKREKKYERKKKRETDLKIFKEKR